MRLTLRTLLAYLDDILEPDDRASLQQKIEESEFAKGLIDRSRDVVTRHRIGAPPISGRGVARDANSVAEYLDNTMAPEQIQEFERVCLESDMNLAEVTSCHHVLAMVLGEPAEVQPAMRQRMYHLNEGTRMRLSDFNEPAATTTATAPTPEAKAIQAAQDSSVATSHERQEDEAPAHSTPAAAPPTTAEWPAPPSSRFRSMAITAVIAAIVTGALILAFDRDSRWWRADDSNKDSAKTGDVSGDQAKNKALAKLDAAPAEPPKPDETTTPEQLQPGTPPPVAVPSDDEPASPIDEPGDSDTPGEGPSPADAPDTATQPGDTQPAGPGESPDPGVGGGDSDQPTDLPDDRTPPAEDMTPDDVPAPDDTAGPDDGMPPKDGSEPTTDDPADPEDQLARTDLPPDPDKPVPGDADAGTQDPEPMPPEQSVVVGRLLSDDQVLLRTNSTIDTLARVPTQAALNSRERLIALPAFRPMISATSTTIELDGGTSMELIGLDKDHVPEIAVHHGRVILRSLGMPNAKLGLQIGDHRGVITFRDAESICGVEVRPFRTAGTDPEKIPSHHAVDLYAVSGGVTWTSGDDKRTLTAPLRTVLAPYPLESVADAAALPAWLTDPQISPLDKRAIPWIEQGLRADRSVKLGLSELADHRRWEIRRLALQCSAAVGYFDPLVQSLRDEDMKSHWNTLFVPELAHAVKCDSEMAGLVREALEKVRGEAAFDLYRMLWGYSRTGLTRGGEAQQLVDFLDHDDLDYRVLAFWNLQEVTGLGMHYQPEETKLRRRQSVERWQKKAEREEIVPVAVPGAAEPPTSDS